MRILQALPCAWNKHGVPGAEMVSLGPSQLKLPDLAPRQPSSAQPRPPSTATRGLHEVQSEKLEAHSTTLESQAGIFF